MAARKLQVNSLSWNGSNVVAVLNGVSYQTLIVTPFTANTLYFVYFVAGSLVISTSPNSVGPGTAGWVLVGAFYTNGMGTIGFGSFVNIDGPPKSSPSQFVQTVTATTNPTKPTTVVVRDYAYWYRDGEYLIWGWDFQTSGPGDGQNGSGNYNFPLPANLSLNLAGIYLATLANDATGTVLGFGHWNNSNYNATVTEILPVSATAVGWRYTNSSTGAIGTAVASAAGFAATNGWFASMQARAKISGWSNTQLRDL